ncbi:MAG: hypothetical protein ACUZ8H_04850 [Candidatus Anammoxibacter sp.]
MGDDNNIEFGVKDFSLDLSFSMPGQLLDAVMYSGIVRLLGGLVCVMLAFLFGIMFIIGGVSLINGKKAEQKVVVVESQDGVAGEAVNENVE